MKNSIFLTLALLFGMLIPTAYAVDFYGNESHKEWRSSPTAHFDFHYDAHLVSQAEQTANIAEQMYDSIAVRYPSYVARRMDFTVNNALYSNGSANFLQSGINIWLTDWGIKLRSTHEWLADVVTHEFAHIISIQSGVKTKPYFYTAHLMATDYYDARVRKDFSMVMPNFIQPHWLAEGTAQYESERMGYDRWDAHRDMIMRVATLNNIVLPIEKMNSFTTHGLEVEQGPYTQGFSLVKYIAANYGDSAIPKLWEANSDWYRATFSGSLQAVLGLDEETLYADWKNSLQKTYNKQDSLIGEVQRGEAYTTDRIYYDYPTITPKGDLYVVAGESETSFKGVLLYMLADSLKEGVYEEELESTLRAEVVESAMAYPVLSKGFSVFSKDTLDYVAYISAETKDKQGTRYFDIRITCRGSVECDETDEVEVTRQMNAVYPNFSPDGKTLVFVIREFASTEFALVKVSLDSLFEPISEIDTLFTAKSLGATKGSDVTLFTPKFSPDGNNIALSYYQGGLRKVAIMNHDGGEFKSLPIPARDVRDPDWVSDSVLVFSATIPIAGTHDSLSPEVFNLYTYNLMSNEILKQTNVYGGAFNAVSQPSDTALLYIGYDMNGFSLYKKPLVTKGSATKISALEPEIKKKQIVLGSEYEHNFRADQAPYSALPRSTIISPLYLYESNPINMNASQTERVHKVGVSALLTDPIGKNEISALLLMELNSWANPLSLDYGINPEVNADMMLSWKNRVTPVTFELAALQSSREHIDTIAVESGGGITEERLSPYAVKMNGFLGSASYSVFKENDFIALSSGYTWSSFNFYTEPDGVWDFNIDWRNTLQMGVQVTGESYDAEGLTLPGAGVAVSFSWAQSQLFRPGGDFSRSFSYTTGNVRQQNMTDYSLFESDYSAYLSFPNPLLKESRVVTTLSASALLNWQADKPESDTTSGLDNYFRQGLLIAGYPFVSGEDLAILGENTLLFTIEHQWALLKDLHKSFWIVHLKDLYGDLFFQAGKAWNGKYYEYVTEGEYKDVYRSWGFGVRLTQKMFYHYPFELYVRYAKALDPLLRDGSTVSTIDLGVPGYLEPTRLEFGFHISIPSDPSLDTQRRHPFRAEMIRN